MSTLRKQLAVPAGLQRVLERPQPGARGCTKTAILPGLSMFFCIFICPAGISAQGNPSDWHRSSRRSILNGLAARAGFPIRKMAALHAALVHPQIAGGHHQIITTGCRRDHHPPAAREPNPKTRKSRRTGRFKPQIPNRVRHNSTSAARTRLALQTPFRCRAATSATRCLARMRTSRPARISLGPEPGQLNVTVLVVQTSMLLSTSELPSSNTALKSKVQ